MQDAGAPLRSVPNPSLPFATPPIPPPHTAWAFAVAWFMHRCHHPFSDSNSASGLSDRRSSRAFRPKRSAGSGYRIHIGASTHPARYTQPLSAPSFRFPTQQNGLSILANLYVSSVMQFSCRKQFSHSTTGTASESSYSFSRSHTFR